MSRSRDLANLANNATGLETLTVSDITDLTATADELNYSDGVSSALQTQIDTKASTASPTFTGTSTFADLKATAIKHTNGTTAITINSDGSLSGDFEGSMKFKQIGRPSSGTPASGKTWITYGITTGHETMSGLAGKMAGWGFGFPCAIKDSSGTETFLDGSDDADYHANQGQLTASSPTATDDTASSSAEGAYRDHRYTYTVEMSNV